MIDETQRNIGIGSRVVWGGAMGIATSSGEVINAYGKDDVGKNQDFAILVEKEDGGREIKLVSQVQLDDEEGMMDGVEV